MLINNHCDFDVVIEYNNTKKTVRKNSSLNVDFKANDDSIVLKPKLKHKVNFNPILYIFMLDPDDIECKIICSCELNNIGDETLISLHQKLEVCGEIEYYGVVAEGESGLIDCEIKVEEPKKLKRKYYFYQLMFVARFYLFPPALYFLCKEFNLFIFLVLVMLLFGLVIPSFKRMIRFSKDCKQDFNKLFKLKPEIEA